MTRPSARQTFLAIAAVVAERGTCARRKVGCVLVNFRGHVLATGYNGVAAGETHCSEHPCPGAGYPSGQGLEHCQAIHAEANALLQCKDVYEIDTAYVTVPPCVHCVKLLMNTSCKVIVFDGNYPHMEQAQALWTKSGERHWIQYG